MGRPKKVQPPEESPGSDPNVVLDMIAKARALVSTASKRKGDTMPTGQPMAVKAKPVCPRPPATPQQENLEPPKAKAKIGAPSDPASVQPAVPAKADLPLPPPVKRHTSKSPPDPVPEPEESTPSQRVREALLKAKALRVGSHAKVQ